MHNRREFCFVIANLTRRSNPVILFSGLPRRLMASRDDGADSNHCTSRNIILTDQPTIKQLHWQCRRGMLELDIVLGRFLNNRYESLTANEQQQFVALLTAADPELYAWLVTKTAEPPTDLENIVNAIRTPIIASN